MIRRMAGFTLVEAILVIVITGILAGIVAVFIVRPVQGYVDTVGRADLTDAADTALRRITRDVRTALPNSLRAPNPASNSCFEFLPTVGGGRYRAAYRSDGTGDPLDFSTADTAFDVLVSDNLTTAMFANTYHAVIYNLGIAGADAYDAITNPTNTNRAQIKSTSTAANIVLNAGNKFPFESPGKRFHVIPDFSVVYSCSENNLLRSIRTPIPLAPLAACPAAGTVLVSNVDCTQTTFNYTPAVSQRNGLLTITLVLTQSGESVRLYDEVHVNNVP